MAEKRSFIRRPPRSDRAAESLSAKAAVGGEGAALPALSSRHGPARWRHTADLRGPRQTRRGGHSARRSCGHGLPATRSVLAHVPRGGWHDAEVLPPGGQAQAGPTPHAPFVAVAYRDRRRGWLL